MMSKSFCSKDNSHNLPTHTHTDVDGVTDGHIRMPLPSFALIDGFIYAFHSRAGAA